MNLKEELVELKKKLKAKAVELQEKLNEQEEVVKPNPTVRVNDILLDRGVDNYIKWNYRTMVKGNYTDTGEYRVPIELRNLIEKMAVWYELRYPDYEINRLMPGSNQERTHVSDVMFSKNRYINELFDENSDVRSLDWDEFYNTHAFIHSLPHEEKYRFKKAKFGGLVYLGQYNSKRPKKGQFAHLHLNQDGYIIEAEEVDLYSDGQVTNEELKGMHVIDVVYYLREKGVNLPRNSEIYAMIEEYEKQVTETEGLLDAVMYRILERGGNRMGPRRAFLFAKEFDRDIDIPMMYAVDRSDPGLRSFMNEYIKAGGDKDLVCYEGYFSRTNKTKTLNTVTVQDLILTQSDSPNFYTPEEHELHERMVSAIASTIPPETLRKEKVKQLRIERKLQKVRQRQENNN